MGGQFAAFYAHDPLEKNQPKHIGKPVFEKHPQDFAVTWQLGGELQSGVKMRNHVSSTRTQKTNEASPIAARKTPDSALVGSPAEINVKVQTKEELEHARGDKPAAAQVLRASGY
jgi:hypothetical protein